jgi:hypothetical protein
VTKLVRTPSVLHSVSVVHAAGVWDSMGSFTLESMEARVSPVTKMTNACPNRPRPRPRCMLRS